MLTQHCHPPPARPNQAGNYLPALRLAERCLLSNTTGSCALMLVFLSDGRPSDRLHVGPGSVPAKWQELLGVHVGALASRFGRRLTVGTIGFGAENAASHAQESSFALLRAMADCCQAYGSAASFQSPELTAQGLRLAITALSSTLTATKTEMTVLGGAAQRTVRDVRREGRGAHALALEFRPDNSWFQYNAANILSRMTWSAEARDWVSHNHFVTPGARAVAVRDTIFGEGAERMVRKFREVGANGVFVGTPLVAKESRFVEEKATEVEADARKFHRLFCETQRRAQALAIEFNAALGAIPGVTVRTPRVAFLDCSVYVVQDSEWGITGLLVEKMLDDSRYKKWNSNNGFVDGMQRAAAAHGGSAPQGLGGEHLAGTDAAASARCVTLTLAHAAAATTAVSCSPSELLPPALCGFRRGAAGRGHAHCGGGRVRR